MLLRAALASAIDNRPAYLAGIGFSEMVAQVAAIEHPNSCAGLILYGTRPVARPRCQAGAGSAEPTTVFGVGTFFAREQVRLLLLRTHTYRCWVGDAINLAVQQRVHVTDDAWT